MFWARFKFSFQTFFVHSTLLVDNSCGRNNKSNNNNNTKVGYYSAWTQKVLGSITISSSDAMGTRGGEATRTPACRGRTSAYRAPPPNNARWSGSNRSPLMLSCYNTLPSIMIEHQWIRRVTKLKHTNHEVRNKVLRCISYITSIHAQKMMLYHEANTRCDNNGHINMIWTKIKNNEDVSSMICFCSTNK